MNQKFFLKENLSAIWKEIVTLLQKRTDEKFWNSIVWGLKGSVLEKIDEKEGTAIIIFETSYQKAIINNEFSQLINEIFSEVTNTNLTILLLTSEEYSLIKNNESEIDIIKKTIPISDSLNSNYNFDNFCVSDANKQVFSAARAVSVKPGSPWNPLFIYGASGLGKTHLLNAIGVESLKRNPSLIVKFIGAKDFGRSIYEKLTNSKKSDLNTELAEIQNEYINYDILLIDDIQQLSNLKKAREIFFPIFNSFIEKKKQIVFTSDQYPDELEDFEQRFISRFSGGLIVDVVPPDVGTVIEIIKIKIKNSHKADPSLMSNEVMRYLATHFSSNIRELEGAINRLIFWTIYDDSFEGKIQIEDAVKIFKGLVEESKALKPEKIIQIVSKNYKINPKEIKGDSRSKEIVLARQVSIFLIKSMLNFSLEKIGRVLNRNHSTIISSIKKIKNLIEEDENFSNFIQNLQKKISSQT